MAIFHLRMGQSNFHFILQKSIPLVCADGEEWWFESFVVSQFLVEFSGEDSKSIPWHFLSPLKAQDRLNITFIGKLGNIRLKIVSWCGSIPVPYGDWVWRWLDHWKYLKFPNEMVWILHFLVNLDIYSSLIDFAISQSHYFLVIEKDGALRNSCEFAFQQRVMKIFANPGYVQ